MANDDLFDNPADPRVQHGFAQPQSSSIGANDGLEDVRFREAFSTASSDISAGDSAKDIGRNGPGAWINPESFLAVGGDLLQGFLRWGRRQIAQRLQTVLGLLLVFVLLAAICANADKLQALANGGLAGIIPGNTVESPLGGRNGPYNASRSPSATSTTVESPSLPNVTATDTPGVTSVATPSTPAAPPMPSATPRPPQPPTATPKPTPQATLEGKLTVHAPNGANCGGDPCSVFIYAWIGGVDYGCGAYSIKLPSGGSTTVLCRLLYTTPHSFAAGAFSGLCAGCGGNRTADIAWTNPSPFYLGT